MLDPEEKKPDAPSPWDDEVYTNSGVEYRNFYPVVKEEEKDKEDEED